MLRWVGLMRQPLRMEAQGMKPFPDRLELVPKQQLDQARRHCLGQKLKLIGRDWQPWANLR